MWPVQSPHLHCEKRRSSFEPTLHCRRFLAPVLCSRVLYSSAGIRFRMFGEDCMSSRPRRRNMRRTRFASVFTGCWSRSHLSMSRTSCAERACHVTNCQSPTQALLAAVCGGPLFDRPDIGRALREVRVLCHECDHPPQVRQLSFSCHSIVSCLSRCVAHFRAGYGPVQLFDRLGLLGRAWRYGSLIRSTKLAAHSRRLSTFIRHAEQIAESNGPCSMVWWTLDQFSWSMKLRLNHGQRDRRRLPGRGSSRPFVFVFFFRFAEDGTVRAIYNWRGL